MSTHPGFVRTGNVDPAEFAWPVMVLPHANEEAGRRIEDSPAVYCIRLSHGAWWIEVAENPFLVTQNELDAFAEHMGLKPSVAPIAAEKFLPGS